MRRVFSRYVVALPALTLCAGLVAVGLLIALPAAALEAIVADSACRAEGLARPLRQTIVVVDQATVESKTGSDVGDINRRWIGTIVTLAGVQEGQNTVVSMPRERLTVLVAMQDGTDLARVFTGCPPTYSQDELAELEKSNQGLSGQLRIFVGRDPRSRVEAEQKAFRATLLEALVQVARLPSVKPGATAPDSAGFLNALLAVNANFDSAQGIPRLIVISPMTLPNAPRDAKSAREAGFALALKLGADLQRAEVYVTGVRPTRSEERRVGKECRL